MAQTTLDTPLLRRATGQMSQSMENQGMVRHDEVASTLNSLSDNSLRNVCRQQGSLYLCTRITHL